MYSTPQACCQPDGQPCNHGKEQQGHDKATDHPGTKHDIAGNPEHRASERRQPEAVATQQSPAWRTELPAQDPHRQHPAQLQQGWNGKTKKQQ